MNCKEAVKYSRIHMLPDGIYRLAAYLVLLLAITYIKPTNYPLSMNNYTYVMMTTVTILYVEMALFVKAYERKASLATGMFKVIAAPVLLYLLLCFCGAKSLDASVKGALTVLAVYCTAWLAIAIHETRNKRSPISFKGALACGLSILRDAIIMTLLAAVVYQAACNPMALGSADQAAEFETWSPDYTIVANYDDLKVLNSTEDFESITDTEERLELFSEIVSVESNNLGIPYHLKVKYKTLTGAIGEYSDLSKTVYVDESYLNSCSPAELIYVAAHEVRHAYQHQLVHLYENAGNDKESAAFLRNYNVEKYQSEFQKYISPGDDELHYSLQYCERDARDYAKDSCEKWQSVLQDLSQRDSTGESRDTTNAKRSVSRK